MKLEVYRDAKGEWRWRLRHRNGNVMADSAEGYKRRSRCVNAFASVQRACANDKVTT